MDGGQKVELPVVALKMGNLHCIHGKSELGHGFREEYCRLSRPLEELAEFPVGVVPKRIAAM